MSKIVLRNSYCDKLNHMCSPQGVTFNIVPKIYNCFPTSIIDTTLNYFETFQAQSASSFEYWKMSKIVPRNSYCDNLNHMCSPQGVKFNIVPKIYNTCEKKLALAVLSRKHEGNNWYGCNWYGCNKSMSKHDNRWKDTVELSELIPIQYAQRHTEAIQKPHHINRCARQVRYLARHFGFCSHVHTLSLSLSVSLSLSPSLSIYLSIYRSIYLSIYLSNAS